MDKLNMMEDLTSEEIVTELFGLAQFAIVKLQNDQEELKKFLREVAFLTNKMSDVLMQSDDDIGREVTYGHGAVAIIALMSRFIDSVVDAQFEDFIKNNF